MYKQAQAFQLLASTTGAGIAIGTNIDLGGIFLGSAAATVLVKDSAGTTLIETATTISCDMAISLNGPITATSSGGTFAISYRPR